MSLAVGSFTTAHKQSGNLGTTTSTVALPAGMQVGDLLLFVLNGVGYTGIGAYGSSPRTFDPPEFAVYNGTVPAGFKRASGYGYRAGQGSLILSQPGLFMYYKIVDGTETAFTTTAFGQFAYIHVTGWNGVDVNPFFDKIYSISTSQYYTQTPEDQYPIKRTGGGLLIMQGTSNFDTDDANTPFITTTGVNPSWTEVFQFSNRGTGDESGYMFYALSTESDDITGFGVDDNTSVSALYYIGEPEDITGAGSFQVVDAEAFDPQNGANDSTFGNQYMAYAPALQSQSATVLQNTSVTNQDKPTASDVKNQDK